MFTTNIIKGCTLLAAASISAIAPPAVGHADPDDNWHGPLTDLESANPQIPNPNLIFPGQIITYPNNAGTYTVKAGDTLALIAGTPAPAGEAPAAVPVVSAPAPVELPPAATPPPPVTHGYSINWDAVAACESGGNWAISTGNGYSGGLQWLPSTWNAYRAPGDPSYAANATRDQQIAAAERLFARSGRAPWPVCGRRG